MRLPKGWYQIDPKSVDFGVEVQWLWTSYLQKLCEEGRLPIGNLRELMLLLERMDLIVANDCGMFAFDQLGVGFRLDMHGYYWKFGGADELLRVRQLLQVVHEAFRAHRIEAVIPERSHGLSRFLERIGFVKDGGVMHKAIRYDTIWMDGVMYSHVDFGGY